jgi:hypothetical protein
MNAVPAQTAIAAKFATVKASANELHYHAARQTRTVVETKFAGTLNAARPTLPNAQQTRTAGRMSSVSMARAIVLSFPNARLMGTVNKEKSVTLTERVKLLPGAK